MKKKFWLLFSAIVICSGLFGCASEVKLEKEDTSKVVRQTETSVYYGIRFDENRNPNAICHVTEGRNDLNPGDVSGIRMGPGIPSDHSYIAIRLEEEGSCSVGRTNTAAIDSIMSELDQIYVERIVEEVGKYDTVIEFEIHPEQNSSDHDDYYGEHSFRIKRNTEENSYIIQTVDVDQQWGKVIAGQESCKRLFELYEKYGGKIVSYPLNNSPVRYVGQENYENMRIFLWKDLVPEDIVRVEFSFGQVIEDRETIERIANDLNQIICRKRKTGASHSSDGSIDMTIVGVDEMNTYKLRISRNVQYNIFWVSKQVYNPNYEQMIYFDMADGVSGAMDLWNLYDEYQKAYLGIEDYSMAAR